MGNFDDEIRKKLDEGNIEYSPSSWKQMEKKLSGKSSYTEFEKKIQSTIASESIPVPAESWGSFSDKTNLPDEFDKTISDKINNGKIEFKVKHWEDFSEKLNNSNLTSYERTIKQTLNTKEIVYNKSHWKALEKMLNGDRSKKILWRSAAAVLLLISVATGINQFSKKGTDSLHNNPHSKNIDITRNNVFNLNEKTSFKQKSVTINSTATKNSFEKSSIKKSNNLAKNLVSKNSNNGNNVILDNKKNKLFSLPSIGFETKNPVIHSNEVLHHQIYTRKKSKPSNQMHPGATLWMNFWENPALTGFYGKNTISVFNFNDWEFIDENKNQIGEFNFVQPIVRIGAYERRLNSNWAFGGYINDQLMKHWNIREYATSISYTRQIIKGYNFSFGAGATLRSQKLAVNQLTLREKAINSNYIFTTKLESVKSKEEYSSAYHFGGFINNKNFFLGYTAFNFGFTNITNDNDIILVKHCLTGGFHSPSFKKIKASGLLKYEQELFTSYSPAIGLTYDNRFFAVLEYEHLSAKKISLGCQMKNGVKAQFNYSIKNLEDYQSTEINIDNFTERSGYISAGLNYIF